MRIDQLAPLVLLLLTLTPAHGLTRFPAGRCRLDGVVLQLSADEIVFAVNHRTPGETRFRLGGALVPSLTPYRRMAVVMDLLISEPTFSEVGAATALGIHRVLDPFTAPRIYNRESEVSAHCVRRGPTSATKKSKAVSRKPNRR